MAEDPRLKEPEKPVWQMSPAERLSEGLRRRAVLMKHIMGHGAKVRADGPTLIVETSLNNYFIDFADDDPRFIKLQAVYELSAIDEVTVAAAAEATAQSFGAKAILSRVEAGYRLRFTAEIVAVELSSFTSSMALYQAQVEDCRERFVALMATDTAKG